MMKLRDCGVAFQREGHTYTAPDGLPLRGITPIVGWIYPKTYEGIPSAVLDAAAAYGTMVHGAIERYDATGIFDEGEWYVRRYEQYRKAEGLKTIANEYIVTDGAALASAIDLVMEDAEGGIILADIKTTSALHVDNCRLQLSIYAALFERCNPGMEVKGLAVAWIPKQQYGAGRWQVVERIGADVCEGIMADFLRGGDPEPWRAVLGVHTGGEVAVKDATGVAQIREMERAIYDVEQSLKVMKEQSDMMRAKLLEVMVATGGKDYDGELVRVTRRAGGVREDFDKKRFQQEHPDLYAQYVKQVTTKETIQIKIK